LHKKLAILFEPAINLFDLFKSVVCTSILPILKDHFQQINTGKPFPGRVKKFNQENWFQINFILSPACDQKRKGIGPG
jgi:hypothetical protein